jgi:hypothetical protein
MIEALKMISAIDIVAFILGTISTFLLLPFLMLIWHVSKYLFEVFGKETLMPVRIFFCFLVTMLYAYSFAAYVAVMRLHNPPSSLPVPWLPLAIGIISGLVLFFLALKTSRRIKK